MDEQSGWLSVAGGRTVSYRFRIKCFTEPDEVAGADSWHYDKAAKYLVADKQGASFTLTVNGLKGYSEKQE